MLVLVANTSPQVSFSVLCGFFPKDGLSGRFSASDETDREPEGTFGAVTVGRLLCPSMCVRVEDIRL